MANLADVIGGIAGQIARGRSKADAETIEIARAYRREPLLEEFPIPRFSLDEVVIDLKLAISSTSIPKNYITSEAKASILRQINQLVSDIHTDEKNQNKSIIKSPEFDKVRQESLQRIMLNMSAIIPANAEVDVESLSKSAAYAIRCHISDAVQDKTAQISARSSRTFLARDLPQIEARLSSQIKDIFLESMKAQPPGINDIDVQVTASQLEGIPSEKITTMRLTLREADRAWTNYETEDGKKKEKLISV
ncbi:MAG: hypothetical protein MUE87_05310 [Methanothrix sp.]|jgi:hypothetical protein|nr:hypothetical protein [Methanothrix sp.]